MGFRQYIQDATLSWLRGDVYPPPPAGLYVSLHNNAIADAGNEVSAAVGGRVPISRSSLSTPRWVDGVEGGTREIVNARALVFDVATSQVEARSFAIWDAPTGGSQLVTGDVIPDVVIAEGDPAVFLGGSLSIRLS